jgi:hypothetical protein
MTTGLGRWIPGSPLSGAPMTETEIDNQTRVARNLRQQTPPDLARGGTFLFPC